jgi:hypothetical protein
LKYLFLNFTILLIVILKSVIPFLKKENELRQKCRKVGIHFESRTH